MNMFEELRAWADKWKVPYSVRKYEQENYGQVIYIDFDTETYGVPRFSYNTETGNFAWYGGD